LSIGAIRWILPKTWSVAEIPARKIWSTLPILMPCSKRYSGILPQRIRDAKLLAAQLVTDISQIFGQCDRAGREKSLSGMMSVRPNIRLTNIKVASRVTSGVWGNNLQVKYNLFNWATKLQWL
jgi:hypothetical protein